MVSRTTRHAYPQVRTDIHDGKDVRDGTDISDGTDVRDGTDIRNGTDIRDITDVRDSTDNSTRMSMVIRIIRQGSQWLYGYPCGYPDGRSTDRSIREALSYCVAD